VKARLIGIGRVLLATVALILLLPVFMFLAYMEERENRMEERDELRE